MFANAVDERPETSNTIARASEHRSIGKTDTSAKERIRNAKTPPFGWGFWKLLFKLAANEEPDDYLLSHGNPHYHWRGVVSRSCSGWEGVVPTRYGHQA